MNRVQRHRGPDDEGFIFINTDSKHWQVASGPDTASGLDLVPYQNISTDQFDLALGSRRLAIVDLSTAGHMPMSYLDGALWLVFNGEIYNYRELKQELSLKGYGFSSDTDTEVILTAYVEWGVDCLSHFNGMFAFALWDARQDRLFCARDRFGVKPFYFFWNGQTLVFASEVKSLLQHPVVPRRPNDRMIYDYLARGLSDHTDETFFEEIYALPASHFLTLDVNSRLLNRQRWWQASINSSLEFSSNGNEQRTYDEYTCLLEDAVRLRLRSDVPVGSCLSGGLDSSALVCIANRLLLQDHVIPGHLVGEHQKTFTARNRESEIDEYQYSHLIVQQTGAEENLIYPSGEVLWQEIESFVWSMDEPVDSTSQYPQWNVMRLARQRGVTVLLDGQGGDETLAGYYSYYPSYLSQVNQQKGWMSALKAGWDISNVGGAAVRNMLVNHASNQLPWRLQQIFHALIPPRGIPGGGGSGLTDWQLEPNFVQRFWEQRWQPNGMVDSNGLAGLLYNDLTSTNLPKLLRYEDRNSMAFSLETRLPFLDFRLVEMVFSLPLSYRIHNGWNKWILRRSMSNILPQEICWRRSKLGFPTPEKNWLYQGVNTIRSLLRQHDNEQLATYLQPGVLSRICEQSDADLAATPGLWRIINLIIWLDLYINRSHLDVPETTVPVSLELLQK